MFSIYRHSNIITEFKLGEIGKINMNINVDKKIISVIGPLFNEGAVVDRYCQEVISTFKKITKQYALELILVDDGSSDDTLLRASEIKKENPNIITLVKLSRNFGLEGAIDAGLRVAKGDAVITMDADLQDPPSVILEMVKKWENGADIVVGSRSGRPNDSFFKKLTASFFYKLMDNLSGKLKLERSAANFRLLSRNALNIYLSLSEKNRVFRVLVPFLGMKVDIVEYERDKRFSGETKYNLSSMIRYALDSITGISIEPLRKIYILSVFSFLIFLISAIGSFFFDEKFLPFFILGGGIWLLFSFLFAAMAIISEYIGQIFIEVKNRPASIIYSQDLFDCDLKRGD